MAMHVAMAMTPPLSLSGKTPRLSITRPANSAILIEIKAIISPPFHASLAPFFAPRLGRLKMRRFETGVFH